MRFAAIISIIFLLTGCLDYTFALLDRAQQEIGTPQEVADVAGDQVVKAESFTRWYYAARAGDSEAQYQLGKSLCCGKRPLHNSYDALKWFCSAARQGQRDAILEVGRMYEKEYQREGSQMPKDDALAYAYYSKAAERDSEAAASMLSSLHWRISERDLKQAKEYIQKWPDIPCEIN